MHGRSRGTMSFKFMDVSNLGNKHVECSAIVSLLSGGVTTFSFTGIKIMSILLPRSRSAMVWGELKDLPPRLESTFT